MMQLKYLDKPIAPILLVHAHYTIGRSAACDIQLDDDHLLNIHAHLHFNNEENALVLIPEGSGMVTINREQLTARTRLTNGDTLGFGAYHLMVVDSRTEQAQTGEAWSLFNEAEDLPVNEFSVSSAAIIGRGHKCDIHIDKGNRLSRRHAKLSVIEGEFIVEDLGSSNGTFVNGSRVEKTSLKHDDEVSFAEIKFRVRDPFFEDDDEKTAFLSLSELEAQKAKEPAATNNHPSAIERQLMASKKRAATELPPPSEKISVTRDIDQPKTVDSKTMVVSVLLGLLVAGLVVWLL
jgi:pSer/pThr/pTyr-binding forkhead associated (FHA) protein